MQIEARFRRRAAISESIADLNGRLLARLSQVSGLWGSDQTIAAASFNAGNGESAATDLSACLENGIEGAISYASRLPAAVCDRAVSDDFLTLVLDSDIVDFRHFSETMFPEIVKAFDPYRATTVTDLDQDLEDFEQIVEEVQRTGLDVDGRDTVFRIYPVNFFDNTLCLRAFGIDADEVVAKLTGSIELAEKFHSGALLRAAGEPAVGMQLIAIDGRIRQILQK